LEISGPASLFSRAIGVTQLPFIASVLSLTSLLDFGGDLLKVYEPSVLVVEAITGGIGIAIFFGYPWFAKHRDSGVPRWVSFGNVFPSFLMTWVMSAGCALIWQMSSDDVETMWGAPLVLMFFFASIFIAAFKGAFETDT
jgi:hypothetical protein